MLTEGQIKNLKPGDPIVINTTFSRVDADGDIRFNTPSNNGSNYEPFVDPDCVSLPPEHVTSLPTVKYGPYLLFKKGDMVQPRSGKTVLACEYGFITFHELDGQYEVNEDEARGTVTLIVNGHACFVSAFALELVTPVEELEPFYLDEITDEDEDGEPYHCFMIKTLKGEDRVRTYYSNKFETIEQTKAAAEAECKRLNEEYRKEQNHD